MTKTTLRVGATLVTAWLAASTLGCKDKSTLGEGGRETIGQYAAGYNEILGTVPKFLTAYFSQFGDAGMNKDNVPTNTNSFCMFNAGPPMDKIKPAFAAAKKGAGDELKHLGPLSDEVLTAVTEIEEARVALCKYLEAEDYKDDEFKLGQELHKKFDAGAERYSKAFNTFSDALDEIEDKQVIDQIKKYEGKKNASYWYRNFTHQCKVLLKKAQADTAAYVAAYDAWNAHYEGLTKYGAEAKGKVNASFDAYIAQGDRFAAEAKKLRRALEEAKTDEEREKVSDGGRDSLISIYNSMLGFHEGFASLEEYGKLN